jgi:two-component system response regulator (stage 0 sporulation protein F)
MKKFRVMIADDEPDLLFLYGMILRQCDFDVIEADDGHSACELALSHSPDAVLIDNRMPRMTGSEVIERLLENGLKTEQIVLISGAPDVFEVASRFKLSHCLKKPVSPLQLMAAAKAACGSTHRV